MDDISDIQALYDNSPEREEERLDRHQLELALTWRYLERYLPASGYVLELGAAGGRYTIELARRGFQVTALDLSARQTELSRRKAVAAHLDDLIRYMVGDARDLSLLIGESYDAVLIMGPLYHLIYEEDRRSVLHQAYGLLRPGGLVATAFICRFGILGDLLKEMPEWITHTAEVTSVLEWGRDPEDWPRGGFRGYFARPEEIIPLHETEGFETLKLASVEPCIGADDESYNRLSEPLRSLWLDTFFRVSAEPSLLGASRHLLYLGRRPG